jgi:hypothetical protein
MIDIHVPAARADRKTVPAQTGDLATVCDDQYKR